MLLMGNVKAVRSRYAKHHHYGKLSNMLFLTAICDHASILLEPRSLGSNVFLFKALIKEHHKEIFSTIFTFRSLVVS
jgi:hypothetical protein